MNRLRSLTILFALTALAACGSNGSSVTAPSTKATTTTTLSAEQQAVQPLIDAGTLTLADLPDGFLDTGQAARSQADAIMGEEPICAEYHALTDRGISSAISHLFARDGLTAFDQVDVYGDAADAATRMDLTKDPGFVGCLQARFEYPFTKGKVQVQQGATFDGADISPLALDPAGDDVTGFRVTGNFTIKTDKKTTTETVLTDLVYVQVGRTLVTLQSTGGTAADFAAIETTALPAVAGRLQAALAA